MEEVILRPRDAADLLEAVQASLARGMALEVVGRASKRALGRPVASNAQLDLSALAGVTLYEPEELVMRAGAATPLSEILRQLAEKGQELAFEPPDLGPLYGLAAGQGSIGGAFLCNLSGPRRFKAGAARDHLLGFRAVSGRGEAFKAGGRVVKNVTGYDLPKLLCGSFGTLAVASEVTFKVLPAAEKVRTLLLFGLDAAAAVRAMAEAAGSPHEVSGLAHLPAPLARASGVDLVRGSARSVTAIRVEGFGASVEARLSALRSWFSAHDLEELHSARSRDFWRELRDVAPLLEPADRALWRLSAPPMEAPRIVTALERLGGDCYLDWAGGLIWYRCAGAGAEAGPVRAALGGQGHAMLIRASRDERQSSEVFHPEAPAIRLLGQRIKDSFDPERILNRGRIWPE
ncbi:MAG: FAD-binding protein [Alphaproteobacteria bacterium]|nr:FAD-binding protein [Alphaproteobacteria bacterium]